MTGTTTRVVMLPCRWIAFLLFLGLGVLVPLKVDAQVLVGRVMELGRELPVSGAEISLIEPGGRTRAVSTTDSLGWFEVEVPDAGEYVVESARLGFERVRSEPLSVGAEGRLRFDLFMRAVPVPLEGMDVSVSRRAEELLRRFGQTPGTLDRRWIDQEDIERMPRPTGPLEVIRWRGVPGLRADEGQTPGTTELCVRFRRTERRCALVLLNGVEISRWEAQQIRPPDLEAIAILTPTDASTFYGTRGGGGAILLWTRGGGRDGASPVAGRRGPAGAVGES